LDEINQLPRVSILMSVYNEEKHLANKLRTLLSQDYKGILNIYIGSDASSDRTNEIMEKYSQEYDHIYFYPYKVRRGKPSVINDLHATINATNSDSDNHIYILTDANVMLNDDVVSLLVKHFSDLDIGLVDAHMKYSGMSTEGISESENQYLNSEVKLKQNESTVWKRMIGPFGGCYALRSNLFAIIPSHFLVDDFYLALNVFDKGKLAINELNAICQEPVTHNFSQEYKRKKRISAGSFQNFNHYRKLFNPFTTLGFSLVSHKLIRWMGPFIFLCMIIVSIYMALQSIAFYQFFSLLLGLWFIVMPLLDYVLSRLGIHVKLLRSISYFNLMNLALLDGFIKYIKGIKSGTWERTERL
jgi:cellulose synthase/poly-beta-1,6-N-acetylglucosamine synthase-like glycosyltransferase